MSIGMQTVLMSSMMEQFDGPEVKALVLMGSFARGDAGLFSDVDLVRFINENDKDKNKDKNKTKSHLIENRLVVVSDVCSSMVEEWFNSPEVATNVISGLRSAKVLIDRANTFASIQARAHSFIWDKTMQQKANDWASIEMVGYIEEVHKGLEGLRHNDIGRLLNAQFGCSWGLSRVIQVQHGILLTGDNTFYKEVAEAVGQDSEWVKLRNTVFGIARVETEIISLQDQVKAGLCLYEVTADLISEAIRKEDKPLIEQTVQLIRQVIH
jgi:predicted nucleotidyltransferase